MTNQGYHPKLLNHRFNRKLSNKFLFLNGASISTRFIILSALYTNKLTWGVGKSLKDIIPATV
jgi:hypothetical protein